MIRSQNVITSTTWANKPASYITGQPVFISNAGTKGSHWFYDGTRWKPVNGTALLASVDTPGSNIDNTETVVLQYLIPAGLWQTGDRIRIFNTTLKSGTTDTCSICIRIGTAGTTADTQMYASTQMGATFRSVSNIWDIRLVSATSARMATQNLAGYGAATTNAHGGDVAISSATANALYVSLSIKSSSTNDTVQINDGAICLVSKAN